MSRHPQRTVLIAVTAVILASFGAGAARAQSASPFAGTWVLDLGASTFEPAEFMPDEKIVTIEMVGNQMRHHTRTVRGEGRAAIREVEYTVGFDGSEVTVPSNGARIMLKRVDDMTFERMARADGDAMETSQWTVSDDQTTLTITTEGVGPFGAKYTSTQVFNRETED